MLSVVSFRICKGSQYCLNSLFIEWTYKKDTESGLFPRSILQSKIAASGRNHRLIFYFKLRRLMSYRYFISVILHGVWVGWNGNSQGLQNTLVLLGILSRFLPEAGTPREMLLVEVCHTCEWCEIRNKAKNQCSALCQPWKDCSLSRSVLSLVS